MTTLNPRPTGRRLMNYQDTREALYHPDLIQGQKEFEPGNLLENVVMQLHGDEHKHRRRRQNPLFRPAQLEAYETEVLPDVIEAILSPLVARGGGDLVEFGYDTSLAVSAHFAGVDLDWRDPAQRKELMALDRKFMQGALLPETKEELIDEVRAEVQAALRAFDEKFYRASRERRETLIAAAANDPDVELPNDLLTAMLLFQDELGVDDGTVLRETAFFLESGGQTSVQLLTNSLDILLADTPEAASYRERARGDLLFAQRCVIEAQRVYPQNPAIRRRANKDTEIGGCPVQEGELLLLDLFAANFDPEVWGADAKEFKPERSVPKGASPWGLSFSGGVHTCIGRTLAVGSIENLRSGTDPDDHVLFGMVPRIVHALLGAGVASDPDQPGEFDPTTYRRKWHSYPIRFPHAEVN